MSGFLSKLFSTDSIISRLIRSILLALMAGVTPGGDIGGVHIPSWVLSLIGILVGMIPAGQNNPSRGGAPLVTGLLSSTEVPTPVDKIA